MEFKAPSPIPRPAWAGFEQLRKQPPVRKGETTTRSKAQTPATKTQPPSM
jgi:hypothetical protein